MALEPGDDAPDFDLVDQDGKAVSLAGLKGGKVLLYFYPKDDTPGCTKEACQFNDSLQRFKDQSVTVLGVSADDAASHQRFIAKYSLGFPLLVDEGAETAKAYGAYGEKTFMGRTSVGIKRSTFLIDEQGKIERAWYNVRADGHPEAVLGRL